MVTKLIGSTLIGEQGKFFDATLVSFDADQGIKSSRNKWRTSVMLSEISFAVVMNCYQWSLIDSFAFVIVCHQRSF